MSRWPLSGRLELSYSLSHPGIPAPRIGHGNDWDRHHAHIPGVKLDHRTCPAIIGREQIGITLFMPYTVRFHRDGRLEMEAPWTQGGPSVHSWKPEQALVEIGDDGAHAFPGDEIVLPFTPEAPMKVFSLGDIRVGTWVLDSGVAMRGLPSEYTLFILPLPNHVYPATYGVSQGLGNPRMAQGMNLRIPIDFYLSQLPPDEEAIVIPYGTPMCQYLPIQLPVVTLRESAPGEDSVTPDTPAS
jgi:hypothetical protein